MRIFNQITVGKGCTAYGGCTVNILDASKMQTKSKNINEYRSNDRPEDKNLIRFPKTNKDFFFLLKGSLFLTYGSSETFPLSSPYESTEFVDYVNRWNYDENFHAKSTNSTVFLYTHILDDIENVIVKVAVLEPGSTVKSVNANSKLLLVKEENTTCEIDGIQYTNTQKVLEIDNLSAKDVNINVSERSHLIYLQS